MANQVNTSGRGGTTGIAAILGAIVVGLLVLSFFVFGGDTGPGGGGGDTDVRTETPNTGGGTTGGGTTGGGTTGGGQSQ